MLYLSSILSVFLGHSSAAQLFFNAVVFWCALIYSCPKAAAEEQCVSRLQSSCMCMHSGHQSAGTVLG